MSDWQELQKEGDALGVFKRGMNKEQLQEAVDNAKRGRSDMRSEEREARDAGRTPLGGYRQNLAVPEGLKQPGYHYRFFVRDNLQRAKQAGYLPVLRDGEVGEHGRKENQWFTVAKGRKDDGESSVNYLMCQAMVHREEDQAIRRAEMDAIDESLKRGVPADGNLGESNYVPTDSSGRNPVSLTREVI